jgi:cold shock CspA family protein
MQGTMLWFNETKDHGFISTDEGERLYVHGSGFPEGAPQGPCAGTAVDFRVVYEDDRRQAVAVTIVPEVAPRRARRRHRH